MNNAHAVQLAAQKYLAKYGTLTRDSASRLTELVKKGQVNLVGGLTQIQALETVRLISAFSYSANPTGYRKNQPISPEKTIELLKHPDMKTPEVRNYLASLVGEHSTYAEAVHQTNAQEHMQAQQMQQVQEHQEQVEIRQNTGLHLPEEPMQLSQEGTSGSKLVQGANGNYARVSTSDDHTSYREQPSSGEVHALASGKGYQYRGNLATSGGDSRGVRAHTQSTGQTSAQPDGTARNTAVQR